MAGYEPPTTIYGIDFSASSRDAGRNTWIAEGTVDSDGLAIEQLSDAASLLDCGPDRESTLDALANCIRGHAREPVAFGLDFPFGLPVSLLDGDEDWHAFVADVPNRWGALDKVDSPTALYEEARAHVGDTGASLHRETDGSNRGQQPTGFRIKTQTYYGVSKLLAEVVDDVSIPPMDDADGRPLVLETYPACTFEELDGAVRTGYKRDTRDAIDRRRSNVDALAEAGVDFDGHEPYAEASDDALDAVGAAYATFRATREEGRLTQTSNAARREGYIYGGEAIDAGQ